MVSTTFPSQSLSRNELKDAFFSRKTNESPSADEINFNVIKNCFGELCGPLKSLFDSSLQSGLFPDLMKITIVSLVFKTGNTADISNYCPILPCFSKILERVMYNRLYKYLTDQKYQTQNSWLQKKAHSIEHEIAQLADQIYESCENDIYTVGIFVDLSKTFNTVNHTRLLKKLEIYRITGASVGWLRSYLTNRKQYICIYNNTQTNEQKVTCGVTKGSILGPLLFSIYVTDLPSASNLLIMK